MENDFRLDVDELASLITPRTKLLVINSPANPTGGVLTRGDLERDRRARDRARPRRPRRRDLRPHPVRRRGARLDRVAAGHGRADDRPRRLLEDVRDDRLAARLRDRAAVARRGVRPADHQHDQLRPDVRPDRRGRGAPRPAGRRRRDGRRVPRAARPHRRRPQRDPGHPLPATDTARSTSSRTSPGPG